jgi:aspartate-semialdehyde dehydrogenase
MKDQGLSVAVVGASGAVGREILAVLEERGYPVKAIALYASSRSAGSSLPFRGTDTEVRDLNLAVFSGVDLALFSAGAAVSKEYAPKFAGAGAVVVDNSSAFRMDDGVPLIVPEVNGETLRAALRSRKPGAGLIVANPNCSTIQLTVVLKPLLDAAGIKRVVVSTYQAVSGAGQKGIDELSEQVRMLFNARSPETKHFPHQIAFNCIPQIDLFAENAYTKEEMKVIMECRKILERPQLRITATAVRVPVFSCHSESVNVETEQPLSAEAARDLLRGAPGVIVLDSPEEKEYPLNFELAGTDATYVGRIRADESVDHGLNMWVVADNLRKGAALNAVQIAEIVAGSSDRH